MIKISSMEFKQLGDYIKTLSGLHLEVGKEYLLETRLQATLQKYQLQSFADLLFKAKYDLTGVLNRELVEATTTGETLFFRDTTPFEWMSRVILPQFRASMDVEPKRIWCAAASTGQEPWSLAMLLAESPGDLLSKSKILATDINEVSLSKAQVGAYGSFEVQRGLDEVRLKKHFVQDGDSWKISTVLRNVVEFKKHNLLIDSPPPMRFDVIFCRNVAIYFSDQDKNIIFSKLAKSIKPDGILVLGSTERLQSHPDWVYEVVEGFGIYRKKK